MVSIGINNRDFQAIDKANGIHSDLAIVETVIDSFNRWPLENSYRILKSNVVLTKVLSVLFVHPSIAHDVYVHNVNIIGK